MFMCYNLEKILFIQKLNLALKECRDVVDNKTPFKITQEEIITKIRGDII